LYAFCANRPRRAAVQAECAQHRRAGEQQQPYIHRIPPAAEHIDSLQRHGKMRRRAEHELDGKNAQQQQDGPLQAGHPAVDAF